MVTIYFETSAVIDYLLATGREDLFPFDPARSLDSSRLPSGVLSYLKAILKEDKKFDLATNLRRIISTEYPDVECVISPVVLYECYEWIVEERFRADASEAFLGKFVRAFSRKQVGEYLTQIEKDSKSNPDALKFFDEIARDFSGENLMSLRKKPLSIRIDHKNYPMIAKYAYMQVGFTDVVHLLAAKNLKCGYFFTTDEDFNRTAAQIKQDFGLEVLYKNAVFSKIKS